MFFKTPETQQMKMTHVVRQISLHVGAGEQRRVIITSRLKVSAKSRTNAIILGGLAALL